MAGEVNEGKLPFAGGGFRNNDRKGDRFPKERVSLNGAWHAAVRKHAAEGTYEQRQHYR
jgi:hypothetical protein